MAIETRLGWVLSGPVTGLCSESSSVNALSCHVLTVEASQHGCSNASLDQALRNFWDLETLGINPEESSVYDDFVHTITFQNGKEIRQLTPVNVWKHCRGIDNPADLPFRGAELSMLIDDPLWLNGPKWLCDINPTEDCASPPENAVLEECMLEMRNKE